MSSIVGYPCQIEIAPWQSGMSWTIIDDEGERTINDPWCDIGFPFTQLVQFNESAEWASKIPPVVIKKLSAYERQFNNSIYAAVWFVSRSIYALEIFLDAPLLFWILLHNAKQHNWEISFITHCFSLPRTTILQHCGLPKDKALVKFLKKLEYSIYNQHQWERLKKFILNRSYSPLAHMQYFDKSAVKFINLHPRIKFAAFIAQLKSSTDWQRFIYLHDEIIRINKFISRNDDADEFICQCKSLLQLEQLHTRLNCKMMEIHLQNSIKYIEFPSVNLKNHQHIHHIKNSIDLYREGATMNHCIYSYAKSICNKQYAVFKITQPERATACIELLPSEHQFRLKEIKLKNNVAPSEETKRVVLKWLNQT